MPVFCCLWGCGHGAERRVHHIHRPGATVGLGWRSPAERRVWPLGSVDADAEDGFLRHIRFLIHDRDPLFRPAGREFVAHYHHERNHQGLDNRLILPLSTGVGALIQRGGRAVAGMLTIATAGGS